MVRFLCQLCKSVRTITKAAPTLTTTEAELQTFGKMVIARMSHLPESRWGGAQLGVLQLLDNIRNKCTVEQQPSQFRPPPPQHFNQQSFQPQQYQQSYTVPIIRGRQHVITRRDAFRRYAVWSDAVWRDADTRIYVFPKATSTSYSSNSPTTKYPDFS